MASGSFSFRHALLLAIVALPAGCQAGPRNGNPGAACTDDADCDDGLLCETGFPGGYCTASCAGGAPCPDGTGCVNLSGLELCLRACDDARDCRDGQRCQAGVCDFPCSSGDDCLPGWRCDSDGACVPDQIDCTPEPAPIGCPCAADAQCSTDFCLPEILGSVCSVACSDEDQCPLGMTCRLMAASNGMGGTVYSPRCLLESAGGGGPGAACASEQDCRSGLCFAGHCRDVCTECPAGAECRPVGYDAAGTLLPVSLCFPAGPDDPIELGSFDTELPTATVDLTVDLPAETVSFLVFAETAAAVCIHPTSLVDPSGTIFWSGSPPGLVRPFPGITVFSLLVPDNDTSPVVTGGTWTMSLGTFDCVDLIMSGVQTPVEALLGRVAVYPSSAYGGTLDLNVHLTPASGVTAATATGSLFLTQMLNRFWEKMATAEVGFEVGEVEFFDAPAAYNTIGNNLFEACAALSVPAAGGGPAVNVLIVGDFVNGAAGRSAGAPGTMMDAGTLMSCVAVANLFDNGPYTGDTVAHEVGHFLGLRHTSENGGAACGQDFCWDAISDTGECTDPMVSPEACPDYTNLMFPTNFDQLDAFTPGQALVLSGAPVVY